MAGPAGWVMDDVDSLVLGLEDFVYNIPDLDLAKLLYEKLGEDREHYPTRYKVLAITLLSKPV